MKKILIFDGLSFFIMLCFASILLACHGPILYDRINDIVWDEDVILFNYEYVDNLTAPTPKPSSLSYFKDRELSIYKVPLNRDPAQALEPRKLIPSREILEFPSALGNYTIGIYDELKPDAQYPSSQEELKRVVYTSYQAQTKYILGGQAARTGTPEQALSYSMVNTADHTFKNLNGVDKIQASKEIVIRWTGFGNQVLVQYQKDNVIYQGLSEIDLETAELQAVKIFKQYETGPSGLSGDYYLSDQDEYRDVKILGFEDQNTVYYIEKPEYATGLQVFKHHIDTGMREQLGILDKKSSYYRHLRRYAQVSMKHKKVAYSIVGSLPSQQFLYVANFDGSDVRLLVNRERDLPKGKPLPVGMPVPAMAR